MLFIALLGGRSDGHDFVADAVDSGAVAALVSKPLNQSFPTLVVEDVLASLGTLASHWRSKVNPCVTDQLAWRAAQPTTPRSSLTTK